MSVPTRGFGIVCDAAGRIACWLRDDFGLRAQAPVGHAWQQVLDAGSLAKAEALLTTARAEGAALDWRLNVRLDDALHELRFTAAFAEGRLTLLAFADAAPDPRRLGRLDIAGEGVAFTRLNNDLVNAQRTLMQRNAELKRTNDELGAIRARLEHSQAELLSANQRLLAQANRDGLTGVHNRRAFQARLEEEIERADRYGHALSLAMIDVDHFKSYNDVLGHLAGDDALRAVASALQATVRGCDFVARYGGEEFAVILPNIVGPPAEQAGERLRRVVEELGHLPRRVTISLGLAAHGPLTPTPEDLIRRADDALYRAKQAGRNRLATDWRQPCP